ncbi:MAG: uroporphyrinogen-III C-methyltransferase [Armatimonadota bacterium]
MGKRQGNRSQTGFVWIVGAGPGDARLLTLKAKYCLEQADVVIYDRLISPSILSFARPDAEFIYAGKTPKGVKVPQDWINKTMIDKAKEGKKVVRLKNGDPFVFGRGAEEAEALYNSGVPFEIVPGVTSVVAVPAYTGIPLTDRRFASNFAVLVGKKAKGESPKHSADFQKLAQADTVIVLMAVEELEEVTAQIMKGGKSPDTPAAIIEWGTTPRQKVVVSTLKNLSRDARAHDIQPPAVVVVGEVVKFRERLVWYERKPLFGKRILITHSQETEQLTNSLEDLGAEVVRLPVIRLEPNDDATSPQRAISKTLKGCYEWIVFNSSFGVRTFFESVHQRGFDVRAFPSVKFAVIGLNAKEALKQWGIHPDIVFECHSDEGSTKALILELAKRNGKNRLLLWDGDGEGELLERLSQFRMVDRVCAYRTVPNRLSESFLNALLREPMPIVILTSLTAARAFFEVMGTEKAKRVLKDAEVVITLEGAERIFLKHSLKPTVTLSSCDTESILRALACA